MKWSVILCVVLGLLTACTSKKEETSLSEKVKDGADDDATVSEADVKRSLDRAIAAAMDADMRLNKVWQKLSQNQTAGLMKKQKAWIALKEGDCEAKAVKAVGAKTEENNLEWGAAYSDCEIGYSMQRMTELEALLSRSYSAPDTLVIGELPFYPIGWSLDGKFAYVYWGGLPMAGPQFEIVVQDMVTDEKVWEWSEIADYEENVTGIWDQNKSLLEGKLREYGIAQNFEFTSGGPSFDYYGRSYSVDVATETIKKTVIWPDGSSDDEDIVREVRIGILNNKQLAINN